MTIKAYTFEAKDGNSYSQVVPYSADVDARVRRDLFFGNGDIITVGDRNGVINKPNTVEGRIGGMVSFVVNDSVTFIAGGRMFTMTNERIKLYTNQSSKNRNVGYGTIHFDINTLASDGNFVKVVDRPTYKIGDWEAPKFSSSFELIVINRNNTLAVYTSLKHQGVFCAGGSIQIAGNGYTTSGYEQTFNTWTNERGNVILTNRNGNFTIAGMVRDITFINSEITMVDVSSSFMSLNIMSGTCTLMGESWVAYADFTHNSDSNRLIRLNNITTVVGKKPNSLERIQILGNFTGSLVVR